MVSVKGFLTLLPSLLHSVPLKWCYFLSVLGLRCCAGFSPVAGHRRLPEVASLASEPGRCSLRASVVAARRLRSWGARPQLLRSEWDLPGSGTEPLSLELTGRFFSTELPGKPCSMVAFVLKSVLSDTSVATLHLLVTSVCMKYPFPSPRLQAVCVICPKGDLL